MPVIKSAKKRDRQAKVRQARNYNVRTALKKTIRKVSDSVKEGAKKDLATGLSAAYKIIDTAVKKGILQKNTGARRKSGLAKMVAKAAPKPTKAKAEKEAKEEAKD